MANHARTQLGSASRPLRTWRLWVVVAVVIGCGGSARSGEKGALEFHLGLGGCTSVSAANATLAKALDKTRLARLMEISYQARGGIALADSAVIAKVGLSRTQARKLADIAANRELDLKMVLNVTRFRNAEAKRKFVLEWRKSAEKDMLAVLSAEQKAAFEKMQGKKFDVSAIVK